MKASSLTVPATIAVLVAVAALLYFVAESPARIDNLDPKQFETDAASHGGAATALDGVITEEVSYEIAGGLVLHVKAADGHMHWIVLNQYTPCHCPPGWGRPEPDPASDPRDVIAPAGTPNDLKGVHISARVKKARVGFLKTQEFALDITFED